MPRTPKQSTRRKNRKVPSLRKTKEMDNSQILDPIVPPLSDDMDVEDKRNLARRQGKNAL